jgi:uncharacterized membrane protein
MINEAFEFGRLLVGTLVYRPYVYGFFACFLFFSIRQLRVRGTALFLLIAYAIAYASEFSATRNGFPFGRYIYLDETRTRELWLSNIPFWDSLSFVFLSYFSWLVASSCVSPRNPNQALLETRTAILGGFLMMVLDVVIDPLTLHGDRWFLGKIYYYPDGGSYFGVTLTNFSGWWLVGSATLFAVQTLARKNIFKVKSWSHLSRLSFGCAWGVYAGVLIFNLAITAWIGEWPLFLASAWISLLTLGSGMFRFTRVRDANRKFSKGAVRA